jgi:hypothetical protein
MAGWAESKIARRAASGPYWRRLTPGFSLPSCLGDEPMKIIQWVLVIMCFGVVVLLLLVVTDMVEVTTDTGVVGLVIAIFAILFGAVTATLAADDMAKVNNKLQVSLDKLQNLHIEGRIEKDKDGMQSNVLGIKGGSPGTSDDSASTGS